MPEIRAHWNCDHVYVVWRYDDAIPDCRGFALERRRGGDVKPVHTWVGFEDEVADAGTRHPSTEWPIQRYMWADFEVKPGQTCSYRAVPMTGSAGHLERAEQLATDWTEDVTVSASDKHGMSAYFNRGVVQSQWLARRLDEDPAASPAKELADSIQDPENGTRHFLGGELRKAMLAMLDELGGKSEKTLYACLFELDDPELLPRLAALGDRARVILANGTHEAKDKGDENSAARKTLKDAKVHVTDRMVTSGLSHNKFAVICDPTGKVAERVWTGSTNWAMTGLCTQSNNGLMIDSPDLAQKFRDQWDLIAKAGNEFTKDLRDANSEPKRATVQGLDVTTWFAPGHGGAAGYLDLKDAKKAIDAAQEGILFLMFYPGKKDTLLNYVANRGVPGNDGYDPNLYIHGVINQDTGSVQLVRRGQVEPENMEILTPAGIDERFAFWQKELGQGGVNVHSKVIVIDPFGDKPVVMTGSHNLGEKASDSNDDNLVIVRGSNALAAAYAVNIIGVYTQYRWRYINKAAKEKKEAKRAGRFARESEGAKRWSGLQDDDTWQAGHFDGPRLRELEFWLGKRVGAPAPAAVTEATSG